MTVAAETRHGAAALELFVNNALPKQLAAGLRKGETGEENRREKESPSTAATGGGGGGTGGSTAATRRSAELSADRTDFTFTFLVSV